MYGIASTSGSTSSTTETVNHDETPRMPTLRLVLTTPKTKSLFEKHLKDFFENSTDFKLFTRKERDGIIKQVEKHGHLSKENIEKINNKIDMEIGKVLEKYRNQILKVLTITAEDPPEVQLWKVRMAREVAQSLNNLFQWISKRLDEILQIEDLKKRRAETDDLFKKLDNIMKKSLFDEEPEVDISNGVYPQAEKKDNKLGEELLTNEKEPQAGETTDKFPEKM